MSVGRAAPRPGRSAPAVVAVTDRLVLRRFTPDDLDDLVELDSDPEVVWFVNAGAPVDRSAVREALAAWLLEYEHDGPFGCSAAIERASGEFVGWFHLRPDGSGAEDDVVELGYRLRRRSWGCGLATEGSLALIELAFTTTTARRVRAETMAVHAASRRVMEKCGLRLVRVFDAGWPVRIPGDELGDVEYAIERDEWLAERASE